MQVSPILSAMRRNKVGALAIVAQTAITLAILCNSLFIIQQRLHSSARPSGVRENEVFTMANQWIGAVLWPALRAASISPMVAIRNC
jgi:putative ABC transport system permease protein